MSSAVTNDPSHKLLSVIALTADKFDMIKFCHSQDSQAQYNFKQKRGADFTKCTIKKVNSISIRGPGVFAIMEDLQGKLSYRKISTEEMKKLAEKTVTDK